MRLRKVLAATAVAAVSATTGVMVATASPARAAATIDPERYAAAPAGFGWSYTGTKAGINAWADEHNMRVTSVEVNGADSFAVTYVHNSGTYRRGVTGSASWTTNETAESLGRKLADKRLLDLERYTVDGETRFAATWVDNPATNAHGYWWWLNSPESVIRAKADEVDGRIIDLDHVSGGNYDAVIISPNAGVDFRETWSYFGKSLSTIVGATITNKARVVDLERHADNTYTAILVSDDLVGRSSFLANGTQQDVETEIANMGRRPFHLKRFTVDGATRYTALFVDNMDASGIAARDALIEGATTSSKVKRGFYLKRIDGGVHNAMNADVVFEPASMLKALHHVHTLKRFQSNPDALATTDVTWYRHPDHLDDGGVCAYRDNGDPIRTHPETSSIEEVLRGMMQASDNRKTDAIYNRYGRTALNNTADGLGMTKTELNHRIGCTWAAPDQVAAANELTLTDAGKLYEAVYRANSPYLGTGTARTKFAELAPSGKGTFATVIAEEAASLGVTSGNLNLFNRAVWGVYKPGGYRNGGACDATGCTTNVLRTTGGGMLSLPARNADGTVAERNFVYGAFIDGEFDCGTGADTDCDQESGATRPALDASMAELLRPQIRSALATWR